MSYNKGPGYTGIGSGTGSSTVSNARAPQRVSGTFSSTMPKKDITSSKYSEINLNTLIEIGSSGTRSSIASSGARLVASRTGKRIPNTNYGADAR
jgi:hypothetical protein